VRHRLLPRRKTAPVLRYELGGGRRLRLLEESDADELHALIEANREHLARWMPWAIEERSAGRTLDFIRATRKQVADNNGLQAAIVEGEAIIGVVGFHAVDWANRATSIGYWLDAEHQGQGTMTAAVRALTAHAFDGWGLKRVEIRCAVENARSRAIPERLGFHGEGIRRRAERVGDRWLDHVVYAMLAEDWS
jgi:ribosomal-protein-serine acetyltransferase